MLEVLLHYAPLFGGIAALIAACAFIVAAFQLRLGVRWNRLQAAFTYFPSSLSLETLENELDEKIRFWSRTEPLTREEVRLLMFQGSCPEPERKRAIDRARATLAGLGRVAPAQDEAFLSEMRQTGRNLKAYLNEIERYCAAVRAGVVDEVAARHIYQFKFCRHYAKLKNLIEFVQKERSATVYCELEALVGEWNRKPPGIQTRYRIFSRRDR